MIDRTGEEAAVVVLDKVVSRDRSGPRGRPLGRLDSVSAALGPGVVSVVGAPADGAVALVEVFSGLRPPTSGRVSIGGHDPAISAAVRARVGVLGWAPDLPPGRTVADVVRTAVRARGESGHRFDAVLDPFGLARLHARAPRSLSLAEARAVELALALSTPRPLALVLHEPWSDVAIGHRDLIHQALAGAAREGACVVVVTSSRSDARLAADRLLILSDGRLTAEPVTAGFGEIAAWLQPALGGAGGVRDVAAALASRADVAAVAWDERPEDGSGVIRLRGDVEVCAVAIAEAAHERGAVVRAITAELPGSHVRPVPHAPGGSGR